MPKNPHPPRGGSKKPAIDPNEPIIEFTNAKGDSKKAKKSTPEVKSNLTAKGKGKVNDQNDATPEDAPKKPDTRTLIGGASWTGKLPVNMLSEHCQKQKWEKPEYTMVRHQTISRSA